jgi:hypothetical protein
MMVQVTLFDVLDVWDAHVVLSVATPEGLRAWTQLGHDMVARTGDHGSASDAVTDCIRFLGLVRDRLLEAERR